MQDLKRMESVILTVLLMFILCTGAMAQNQPADAASADAIPEVSQIKDAFPVLFEVTRKAVLSAEMAGKITKLGYDVGDKIKKGAVVARLDTGELPLRKKRSEQALRHLEVQVKDLTNLRSKGLATNEDLAKAKMERDVTRTEIDIVRRQLAKSVIHAPFRCEVTRRHVQPHEWVTEGQPILDVVSLDELRAVGNIPAPLAVQLKKGQAHTFFVSDLSAEVTGKVVAVASEVDERSNTAQVIWVIDKTEIRLLPGMKGEVHFVY